MVVSEGKIEHVVFIGERGYYTDFSQDQIISSYLEFFEEKI